MRPCASAAADAVRRYREAPETTVRNIVGDARLVSVWGGGGRNRVGRRAEAGAAATGAPRRCSRRASTGSFLRGLAEGGRAAAVGISVW